MPGRFPLSPVPLTNDPFCEDGFCGDPPIPPEPPAPVLTSTGNINSPEAGNTLTTSIICEGGSVKYYRNNPAAPGSRVYLSEGPTYTLTVNDLGYSIYSETECPGFDEPIPSNPTPPVGGWTRFTPSGEFAAYRVVTQDLSAYKNCSTNATIFESSFYVSPNTLLGARFNVVGYKLAGNSSLITYVCVPAPIDANEISMGVFVLYSNNTSELIGTYLPNGARYFGGNTYGTRLETWAISITVGGISIYP